MSENVWADGYGKWHASVPISGSAVKDARNARALIIGALQERDAHFSLQALKVTRERVTNHGTVIYGEVWR